MTEGGYTERPRRERELIRWAFDQLREAGVDLADPLAQAPLVLNGGAAWQDLARLMQAFAIFARDLACWTTEPRTNRCGWCVAAAKAAGTEHAWQRAERYDADGIRAHTIACDRNPLVIENNRLRNQLADIRAMVSRHRPGGIPPTAAKLILDRAFVEGESGEP